MTDYRAVFDVEMTFLNGGALQAQGFRLDLPAGDVTESEVAVLLVSHLGLLMVDQVRLSALRVVPEAHRGLGGSRPTRPDPDPDPTRLVELNHVIIAGMSTYPGLPGPQIAAHLTREDSRPHYAPGTEFGIDQITMIGNTGTYLDSPYHRYADRADLADLPLPAVADLPVLVVRLTISRARPIEPLALAATDVAGAAVILHTGWDRHWGTEAYGRDAPFLTGPSARLLAEGGAALVGIDSVNIDDTGDPARPAHSILLGAGIPVLEHLTGLDQLPVSGARLHAAPPRVRNFGTFPVRAYAILPR